MRQMRDFRGGFVERDYISNNYNNIGTTEPIFVFYIEL